MIFTEDMQNLKIYKQQMFLPTVDGDKKNHSMILLLSPNYNASKNLIENNMTINRMRFQSYYLQGDCSYYIDGKVAKKYLEEDYINSSNYIDIYTNLLEMTSAERKKVDDKDFGLPEKRKYPMPDKAHVLSAIKFFNYTSGEDEKILARNINKKIKEYNMADEVHVSDKNRFSKYFNAPKSEAMDYCLLNKELAFESIDYSLLDRELALDSTVESSVYYNGYLEDVLDLSVSFGGITYYEMLKEMKYKISNIRDLPILELTAYNSPNMKESITISEADGFTVLNIDLQSKSIYESHDRIGYIEYVVDKVFEAFKLLEDTVVHTDNAPNNTNNSDPDRALPKEKPMDMEQIMKSFKNKTTSNIKRAYSRRINAIKRQANNIKDQYANIGTISINNTPNSNGGEEQEECAILGESSVVESMNSEDYMYLSDNILLVFSEAVNASYNTSLKRILYNDRMKKRTEVIEKLNTAKADMPNTIKYAYPDLERYKGKNIFVDLYFYNELYFKNTIYKAAKGFNIYLELLNRLINDPRYKKMGYTRKTIFTNVTDWTANSKTKMWLYRESINPISIIYNLMLTHNTAKIKEVFGNTDLIFLNSDSIFKINFSLIKDDSEMNRAMTKLKLFCTKIIEKTEFEPEDIADSMSDSKKAIKAKVVDDIEDARGVDLTPAIKAVEKSKETNSDKPKEELDPKDKELLKIASDIDDTVEYGDSEDDIKQALDMDSDIKSSLADIMSDDDGVVKVTAARKAHMAKVSDEFKSSNINGKTVQEILDSKPKELEKTDLKISSPNEEWTKVSYRNFDKDYNLDDDIVKCFNFFTTVSRPLVITELSAVNNSTSEDRLKLYTCRMEDHNGKRFTLKLDIPIPKDNRFLLRGNSKAINTQMFNMPIVKTELGTCQLISNYQKIFIRRYNTSSGRSCAPASRLLKALSKYEGNDIKIELGENSKICNRYELPIDYIDISGSITSVETKNHIFYFNHDMLQEKYDIDETKGIAYGYDKRNKKVMYYDPNSNMKLSKSIVNMICEDSDKFAELYALQKPSTSGTYAMCSILNTNIPLALIVSYYVGISKVLSLSNIKFVFSEKLPNELRTRFGEDNTGIVRFSDGYLVYDATSPKAELLMNGYQALSTRSYSMADADMKNMYIESLDDYGGRIKADGLDNFRDCFVDPLTKENLEYYNMPTDFIEILLRANELLTDNKFIKDTDMSSRRIRRAEMVAAYTFEALSESYGTYSNMCKHNSNQAEFSIKQSAVVDKILTSPISSDDSIISALNDVETTNAITFKGKGGLNNDRAYSLDKRTFDDSMLNVLGLSTIYSGSVGITRQSTMDMNIDSTRGYVKSIEGDHNKLNAAKTMTATEAMTPYAVTSDDGPRIMMTFSQTAKHQMRTEASDPLLVTNGADEALPYMTTNKFAYKAKDNGKIILATDEYLLVEYKSGDKEYIDLREKIEKNSDAGFYSPLKLDAAKGIKTGKVIKEGEILAYDSKSFSNSLGESDNIAYNIGKLAKVAVINTDEGYEDSGFITEHLAKSLATRIVEKAERQIDKRCNILKMVKIGDKVEVDDALILWQDPQEEETSEELIKRLGSEDSISELGRKAIRSPLTGVVADIRIYRTVELDELSESLRKIVTAYERPIKQLKKTLEDNGVDSSELPATYKLAPTGKLKKSEDAVYFEFFIEYLDTMSVGDKITYFAANKAVLRNIIPEEDAPYTDFRPDEPIDAFLSEVSIDHRMVTSILKYGATQKLLIELDRSIKDILGIPYDVKNL